MSGRKYNPETSFAWNGNPALFADLREALNREVWEGVQAQLLDMWVAISGATDHKELCVWFAPTNIDDIERREPLEKLLFEFADAMGNEIEPYLVRLESTIAAIRRTRTSDSSTTNEVRS